MSSNAYGRIVLRKYNSVMKFHIKTAMGLIFIAPFMVVGTAVAQVVPATPAPGSAIAQRLEQRKKERNIQLDERATKRLIERCVSAQSNIRASQQRLTKLFIDRSKTYEQIDGKIWVTIGQLKLAQKDTFELEKNRSLLAEKTLNAKATAANYQQTLDDMVVINCKADVVGFKALLDTSRLYLVQLREQSNNIRTHIVDDIKPILTAQAADLQPKTDDKGGQ